MEFSLAALLFTPHQFWDLTLGLEIPYKCSPTPQRYKNKQTNKKNKLVNASFGINASATSMKRLCRVWIFPKQNSEHLPRRLFFMWSFSTYHTALTHTLYKGSRLASGRALVAKSSWKPMCSGEAEPLGVRPSQMVSMEGCAGGSNQALQPDYTQGWGWVFIYLVLLYRPVMSGSSLKILSLLCQ